MFLQRLAEYAERLGDDRPPPMYQRQAIRYVIRLDREGRPRGEPVDTSDSSNKATKKGKERFAPHVKRVGVKPKLLADTAAYILGVGTDDANPAQVAEKQAAFAELVRECAETTGEESVAAVDRFLRGLPDAALPVPEGFDPAATMTFQVEGTFPIDLPGVRAFWASRFVAATGTAGAKNVLPCVICGQLRPAEQRHPIKIKGLRGGQPAGTDLISADKRAFESYGLSNSLIAPTCLDCAEKYANGLNALLRDDATHLAVGSLVFVGWTARPVGFSAFGLLSTENESEVMQLLAAHRTGRIGALEIDPVEFYAASLSANGGRAVVRSWLTVTVGKVRRQLANYFALQELIMADGTPSTPVSLWRLAMATVRRGGNEQPSPGVADGLVALALNGTPLPDEVMFQAVCRCRAEQSVTRERAMLIKMVLLSHRRFGLEGDDSMGELDTTNQNPAYVCGRLLAILDAIQRRALGNPNATLVDKFYGAASSAPASVFGTLLHNTQNHLAKLRKNPRTQGAQRALEGRLTDTLALLQEFPATLTLPEQGLFALGYYHQRADDRQRAREYAERRGQTVSSDEELDAVEAEMAEEA